MFEKEAEEYAHEHCCDSCKNLQARYRKVYQDGAEFGYSKCNEQLTKAKELIEELSSSLSVVGECEEEECELLNRAEQFLKEIKEK